MNLSRLTQHATRFLVALLLVAGFAATSTSHTLAQAPTVALVPDANYGLILTDPDGWTLYTWDGDVEGQSNCYDACQTAWPPFLAQADLVAPDALPGALGWIDRGDGTWQVAFNSWPLYYYSGDVNPGDRIGEGSMGAGALWYIMAFTPPTIAAPPTQPEQPVSIPVPTVPVTPSQPTTLPGLGAIPAGPTGEVPPSQVPGLGLPPDFGGPGFLPPPGGPMFLPPPPFPGQQFAPNAYQPTISIAAPANGAVTLNWIGTPNALSYRIYVTLATAPLNLSVHQTVNQPSGQLATNATVAGLTPDTLYIIQVRAVDPTGFEFAAPALAQLLPTFGSVPVVAPGNLLVTNVTASSLTLNWAPIPGAFTYRVWQANAPTGPFTPATLGAVTSSSAVVTGLAPNLTYFFNVAASDASGNQSPPSFIISANTGSLLSPPTSAVVTGVTSSTATLTWGAVLGATMYQINQGNSLSGPFAQVATAGPTTTTHTVTGLAPSSNYFFQVLAVDAVGNTSLASNTAQAVTPVGPIVAPPPAGIPSNLTVTGTTNNSVSLAWTGNAGAASYRVLQSTSPAGPFAITGGVVPGTATVVSGLLPGTQYSFQVISLDAGGNQSAPSNTTTATTAAPPPAPLVPPTISVSSTTTNSAVLSWGSVPSASTYWVYQSQTAGGPFALASTSGLGATGATVTGLSPATNYFFQVRSIDAAGSQSTPSNTATATTNPALTAPNVSVSGVTSTTVGLSWAAIPGATSYVVTQSQIGGFTPSAVTGASNTGATVTGLTPATSYSFRVMAVDAVGNQSPTSSTVIAVTNP